MIKKVETKKTIITNIILCDDCGIEIKRDMACSVARCEICGKDLCDKCIGHEADTIGDYREVYCKKCWDIGEKYRYKINELENSIDDLYSEWHENCLK